MPVPDRADLTAVRRQIVGIRRTVVILAALCLVLALTLALIGAC